MKIKIIKKIIAILIFPSISNSKSLNEMESKQKKLI
jgi:hypothetical protein